MNDLTRSAPDPIESLWGHVRALDDAAAVWATRDDTKPAPAVRQAASDAVDAIDALLRELHEIRHRLIVETRRSDAASAARVDALLAARGHGLGVNPVVTP